MTTMPMTETDFWSRLEYRVCREFEGIEECRRYRLWCDGFIPEDYALTSQPAEIRGRAWIGSAPREEAWRFTFVLPVPVSNSEEIDWSGLLPAENVTEWLRLDRESKHLEIAPGAAEAVEE